MRIYYGEVIRELRMCDHSTMRSKVSEQFHYESINLYGQNLDTMYRDRLKRDRIDMVSAKDIYILGQTNQGGEIVYP